MFARVLVLTLEGQDPHKLMEPFDTYDMEDTWRGPYSVWFNMTEEWRGFYETWVFEGVILKDGRELPLMDPKYQELKNPEQYPRYRRLCSEEYPTFEDFVDRWWGGEGPNEHGEYGYWKNPNGKWDYYGLPREHNEKYHPEGLNPFPARAWNGEIPMAVVTPEGQWLDSFSDPAEAWLNVFPGIMNRWPDATVYVFRFHF